MTTADEYNKALDRVAELQERQVGHMMRIDELCEGIDHVNRVGVLKIRELEARNAKLEARNKELEARNRNWRVYGKDEKNDDPTPAT